MALIAGSLRFNGPHCVPAKLAHRLTRFLGVESRAGQSPSSTRVLCVHEAYGGGPM